MQVFIAQNQQEQLSNRPRNRMPANDAPTSTSVFGDGRISTHADLRPNAARFHERRICSVTITVAFPTLSILCLFTVTKIFLGVYPLYGE